MVIAGFNLASRSYRGERRRQRLAAGAGLVLLLVLVAQVGIWTTIRQKDAAIADRLGVMERELQKHQDEVRAVRSGVAADALKKYEAKVAALNNILEAAAFSWSGLLNELERSVPPGVALSEILPDTRTGRVALRGTARSFAELSQFLRVLEQRTTFGNVFLLRQAVKKSTGGGPDTMEFAVELTYRGRDT